MVWLVSFCPYRRLNFFDIGVRSWTYGCGRGVIDALDRDLIVP